MRRFAMKTLLLALAAIFLAAPAAAGPCADKIAGLQARYDAAPLAQGAAPVDNSAAGAETADAKLHHQPAPANAADADDPAMSAQSVRDAKFKVAMEEATAAEHSGDEGTCETAAARAEQALGR
jgi:hypothetical protein